jgi:hypothetical protein
MCPECVSNDLSAILLGRGGIRTAPTFTVGKTLGITAGCADHVNSKQEVVADGHLQVIGAGRNRRWRAFAAEAWLLHGEPTVALTRSTLADYRTALDTYSSLRRRSGHGRTRSTGARRSPAPRRSRASGSASSSPRITTRVLRHGRRAPGRERPAPPLRAGGAARRPAPAAVPLAAPLLRPDGRQPGVARAGAVVDGPLPIQTTARYVHAKSQRRTPRSSPARSRGPVRMASSPSISSRRSEVPGGRQADRSRRLAPVPPARSHRRYIYETKPGVVTIAGQPNKDVPKGTAANILRQAGLDGPNR